MDDIAADSPPCPRCGTRAGRLIAPGYFECGGNLPVGQPMMSVSGPVVIPGRVSCGLRYQAGVATASILGLCFCSTAAIGRCGECHTPVCGDHSFAGETRICVRCTGARARSKFDRYVDSEQAYAGRLVEVADAKERELRIACYLRHLESGARRHGPGSRTDWIEPLAARLRAAHEVTPWKSAEWCSWFVAKAAAAGIEPDQQWCPVVRRPTLFSTRYEYGTPEPAWIFYDSAATTYRRPKAGTTEHDDAHLLTNGEVWITRGFQPWRGSHSDPAGDKWNLPDAPRLPAARAELLPMKVHFARILGYQSIELPSVD